MNDFIYKCMESSCVKKSNITFGAKPLIKVSVLQRLSENAMEFVPKETHIVEMSYINQQDAKALAVLRNKWVDGKFTEMICSPSTSEARKIYALTTQCSDLENIDTSQVLGLADVNIKNGNANLRFLQAAPRFVDSPNRPTKNIGKSLIQGLVEKFRTDGLKSMDLFAEHKLKPFYKKVCPQILDKESTIDSCTNLILYL